MKEGWSSQKVSTQYLSVNSCGTEEAMTRDIPTFRPQGRVDYHILYVKQGICRIEGDDTRDVPAGSIILFRPGETQKYCFLAEEQSICWYVHFTGSGCEELLAQLLPPDQQMMDIGRSTGCEMAMERMVQEYVLHRPFYRQACAAHLYQLLVLIGRKMQYDSKTGAPYPDKRIERICCLIHQDYRQNTSLETYAAQCCLSPSRFAHLFKQNVGVSPMEYRNRLRIERAKDLLLDTDLPIQSVADLVGFADHSYFSRVFTAQAGSSPSQYRKMR